MSGSEKQSSKNCEKMSELVSKCVLRVEVNDNDDDNDDDNAAGGGATNEAKPKKPSEISVKTFPSRLESPRDDWGLLPASSRETTPSTIMDNKDEDKSEIGFFSGNPFVEITKGTLHLYKEDVLSDRKEALTLCLLGVPASMTCHDLLAFTAPCHAEIAHIRVLRDSLPNQYMALLTFRNHDSAMEFYLTYNGESFNSLEPDNICRIVWVSRVEWSNNSTPPIGHTELPTCPVCLERMDESVDGVLTIQCNHAFHTNCLDKWSDSTCPVCRFVQSPEEAANSECEKCLNDNKKEEKQNNNNNNQQQSIDSLWICLICGHIGCGRYQNGHAALHYYESGHCYALQLGSHRVWDYKGDNFVHRLLQNKVDGKLVPSERPQTQNDNNNDVNNLNDNDKIDSVQLEFTYLLTSQLDEQRLYFEEKLQLLDSLNYDKEKNLLLKIDYLNNENLILNNKLKLLLKDKQQLDNKLQQQNIKFKTIINELNEEKLYGKALRNNQQQYINKLNNLEIEFNNYKLNKQKEIDELNEQLRDLMIFIEAKQTIEQSEQKDDIACGSLSIGDSNTNNKTTNKKNKKKKKC